MTILQRILRLLNERVMFPRRYAFLSRELSPYLAGASSILDVGSSNGRLIQQIAAGLPGVAIAGVDVLVQPDSVIPIEAYDGQRLPYADESFDVVVLIDVLHHAEAPEVLLAEASRVARRHVLIKDHYFKNRLDRWILKWADYGGNAPHGIALPCNYLDLPAWNRAFDHSQLVPVAQRHFTQLSFDPCKHVIYHLAKANSFQAPEVSGPKASPGAT